MAARGCSRRSCGRRAGARVDVEEDLASVGRGRRALGADGSHQSPLRRDPYNYLALYKGDLPLFKHSQDIGFRYTFEMRKKLVSRAQSTSKRCTAGIWGVFEDLGIPLELLRIPIMIPFAAVVVVTFRNVLGLETLGTFLPALIAAAAVQTGFLCARPRSSASSSSARSGPARAGAWWES